MRQSSLYKSLTLALTSLTAMGTAHAAGLDRSGQDVTAFLQDGTYAEAVYTYIDADVSGHDNGVTAGATSTESAYVKGAATGDIAEPYDFFRYGVKTDINDRFSIGVLYDEPFGAAVKHTGDSNFITKGGDATYAALVSGTAAANVPRAITSLAVNADGSINQTGFAQAVTALTPVVQQAAAAQGITLTTAQAQAQATQLVTGTVPANRIANNAEATKGEATNVEIRTHNVTGLLGAKFGANRNFQVYAGSSAQHLTGEVHLRGIAYQGATGYDAKISPDQAYGWVAGVAYSKPEIALKAALTYRSEIEHETKIGEYFPAVGTNTTYGTTNGYSTKDFKVTFPESFNLDFQTGINPTTLVSAKVRYVPWSDFTIVPTTYTQITKNPIVSYSDDQWSVELGLGKKLSDKLSVSGNVGWDSGAGNPTTTLGPIEGYYSVGLGAKYNITPNWSVSAGGKYLMFGDATANLPNGWTAGKFENNDGFIAGLKIAYQAK